MDIAVCHLADNPFNDPGVHTALETVQFDIDTEPEGAPVAFTSFPLNNIHPITSVGIVAGYYWENHQRFLLVDKGAWFGASGAALYGSDGRVVGIVLQAGICAAAAQGSCKYDGLTFAKTAGFIDGFLTQHNVPPPGVAARESDAAEPGRGAPRLRDLVPDISQQRIGLSFFGTCTDGPGLLLVIDISRLPQRMWQSAPWNFEEKDEVHKALCRESIS